MKSILAIAGSAIVLAGCGSTPAPSSNAAIEAKPPAATTKPGGAAMPCAANFTSSGSFMTGKRFSTHSPLPGASKDAAFAKAYASLAKTGYQIVQSDKNAGVISAAQSVSFSSGGKTAPLNVVIQGDAKGSSVSFALSISGGLVASEDAVRDEFCRIAGEMGGRS